MNIRLCITCETTVLLTTMMFDICSTYTTLLTPKHTILDFRRSVESLNIFDCAEIVKLKSKQPLQLRKNDSPSILFKDYSFLF